MTSLKTLLQNYSGALALLLFAGLSLLLVIESRDPAFFMGWVFFFAMTMVVRPGATEQDYS